MNKKIKTNVIPESYRIKIEPDLNKMVFRGNETIEAEVTTRTSSIHLDSKDLNIKSVKVFQNEIPVYCRFRQTKDGILLLNLKNRVYGAIRIMIEFSGKNNDKGYGFYVSKYRYKGVDKKILTTHLEPIYARYVFPCFDDPKLKANFELSVEIDQNLDAVSNMPVKSSKDTGGKKKLVQFYRTPVMSTYLLYLGIGEFEKKEVYRGNVAIRVVTTEGKTGLSDLALRYTPTLLDYYERYFGVKYPLKKLDLIAVPDFQAGAMENWGAITFREELLLADDGCSPKTKSRIVETIAHELAHQWFGNLVTMDNWGDIWLNESFATFMSYKAMDYSDKSLFSRDHFLEDRYETARVYDAIENTHPISFKADNPIDILEGFDIITYDKGSSILNMLEKFVGEENFRRGLSFYIKNNAYTSVGKNAFWGAIDKFRNGKTKTKNIRRIMEPWIEKKGYPVITAMMDSSGKYIEIKQYTFTINGYKKSIGWNIPMTVSNGKSKQRYVLSTRRLKIKKEHGIHINLNYGQSGFYRVEYDETMLANLYEDLSSKSLDDYSVFGMENDMFYLLRSGRIDISGYLDFVKRLNLDNYLALSSAIDNLWRIKKLDSNKELGELVSSMLTTFSEDIIKVYGLRTQGFESSRILMLREKAITTLGLLNNELIAKYSMKAINDYLNGSKKIEGGMKNGVFIVAAWNNTDEKFKKNMMKMYETSNDPEDRMCALAALGSMRLESDILDILDYSLSDRVRIGEKFILLGWIARNQQGRTVMWGWMRKNWKKLLDIFPQESGFLNRYVTSLSAVSNSSVLEDIKKFFSKKYNLRKDIVTDFKRTLEFIESNISLKTTLKSYEQKRR